MFYNIIHNHLIKYPIPINIKYTWSFGSLAGIIFSVQLITGFLLSMHYDPNINAAFDSVEHIVRDIYGGYLLRYFHANGASMFFIVLYIHMARGLYYGSYVGKKGRYKLWASGVIIYLLVMATAFLGYVLPWGQMSYWGATVITNLMSVIPFVGHDVVEWLWGGFSVSNPTLNRFYSLHFGLPFAVAALIIIHLYLLHLVGSSNVLSVLSKRSKITFHPYATLKDVFSFFAFFILFSFFVFFSPDALGHPDNYIEANPMVTPPHIVPEWYFLPFYGILRSIPNKVAGVIAMFFSILILLVFPIFYMSNKKNFSNYYYIFSKFFFWFFVMTFFVLMWVGSKPPEDPYILVGQVFTFFYFIFFIIKVFIDYILWIFMKIHLLQFIILVIFLIMILSIEKGYMV
uniref:Cytochrome b n=1 Tax=Acavomonas peruviana TaxID=1542312 RepID=V5KV67_9ALVE|nr:apocytochrome b [Acavomonas peruviana]